VPCSLEYWDELQHAFVPYREFSLSESSACELTLPSLTLTNEQKELVTSDLWRIVLNNNTDGGDEQSSDSESGSQQGSSVSHLLPCDQLVSPMALAACTRVDSCFAPWSVPSLGVSLTLAQIQLHLCHHLEQLGTVPSRRLRPFLPDRKLPQEQEYLVIRAQEPRVFLRQWSGGSGKGSSSRLCQELQFSTELDCRLLEYRNLTWLCLLQPFILQGQAAATRCSNNILLDGNVFIDPVYISISQYTVHTLDTALQSWQQAVETSRDPALYRLWRPVETQLYTGCGDQQRPSFIQAVETSRDPALYRLWRPAETQLYTGCGGREGGREECSTTTQSETRAQRPGMAQAGQTGYTEQGALYPPPPPPNPNFPQAGLPPSPKPSFPPFSPSPLPGEVALGRLWNSIGHVMINIPHRDSGTPSGHVMINIPHRDSGTPSGHVMINIPHRDSGTPSGHVMINIPHRDSGTPSGHVMINIPHRDSGTPSGHVMD
ncbi:unnamed protein product, partial [Coregonus sp. 'balchen']